MLRARQYVSIHNCDLRLTLQGQPTLTESFDSITKVLTAPNLPTLETLINHIAFSLMDSGISSLSRLLSLDGTHILNGNNLKFKFGSNIRTGNYCNEQACLFVELKEYNPPAQQWLT